VSGCRPNPYPIGVSGERPGEGGVGETGVGALTGDETGAGGVGETGGGALIGAMGAGEMPGCGE